MPENIMVFVWLGLTVIFGIAEAASAQLTTIWFAAGSLVSMLLAIFGVKSPVIQLIVFIVVSVTALIATRPLVKKVITKKIQPTNADRNIGEIGLVTEDISLIANTGAVSVRGVIWTARSVNGEDIPKDSRVKVHHIDGVKLIVEKIN